MNTIMKTTLLAALVLSAFTAAAQLNQNCTVSVDNRTAQVDASGFWQINNIPVSVGLVRARATCVENGVTRIGVSDWFTVPANGNVVASQIDFIEPDPVPAKMSLTATRTTLGGIGSIAQLTATVTLPDNTTRDVTPAANGTSYTTSNRNVITVSPDGKLTAAGTGTVIIGALNEGTLGLLRVSVASGPVDSDGDGMPDDWELTHGLNPNDPADGALDPDGDGLSNLVEYQTQTDPHNADSDGDGIRDGVELQTGSDPSDPNSFNLARALKSIAIAPASVSIIVNTLIGSGSTSVVVTGTLIDNNTINLTSRSRGTVYTSSNNNLFIPSSVVDGRLITVSSGAGSGILTVTNSGFTATAPVTVTTSSAVNVATLSIPGFGNDLAVSGSFLYVAAGFTGMQVVSIADRAHPQIIGSIISRGSGSFDVEVRGSTAYIADGVGGLQIVDISVPAAPRMIGLVDTPGSATDLAVGNNGYVYVADGTFGVQVIDVSDPATARIVGNISSLGTVKWVDVAGTLVAAACYNESTVHFINVTNPAAPVRLSTVGAFFPLDVRMTDSYAYVAVDNSGILAIDITDPVNPKVANATGSQRGVRDFGSFGGFVFTNNYVQSNGVTIWDCANPMTCVQRGTLIQGSLWGYAVQADSRYYYNLRNTLGTLRPVPSGGTTTLYIVQYMFTDDTGTTAPAVNITSPANGATVFAGSTLPVTVTASDDIAVAAVELSGNGRILRTSSISPFNFSIPVTNAAPTVTFTARATDFAGNSTTSASVTVNVVPDTVPPTVQILPPTGSLIGGTNVTVNVTALDNVGVASVTLSANGTVVGTLTSPAYSFGFTLPNDRDVLHLEATAVDTAGNSRAATPLDVAITRDRPPVIQMLTPTSSTTLYSLAEIIGVANASDDVRLNFVNLLINGVSVKSLGSPIWPFQNFHLRYKLPAGMTSVRIAMSAIDSLGQVTTTPELTFNLKPTSALGAVPLPDLAWDLDMQGNTAYTAVGASGVRIIDVSTPSAPVIVGGLDTPVDARAVMALGNYLFVEDGATLLVMDVSNPASPQLAGQCALSASTAVPQFGNPARIYHFSRYGDRLYVPTPLGLDIIDIRNPRNPRRRAFLPTAQMSGPLPLQGTAIYDHYLVTLTKHDVLDNRCTSCSILSTYDLAADPDHPQFLAKIGPTIPNTSFGDLDAGDYVKLVVQGSTAYMSGEDMIYAIDLTNPAAPRVSGNYDPEWYHFGFTDMDARGSLGLISLAEEGNRVVMIGLPDVTNTMMVGGIDFSSFGPFHGTSIAATGELVYATGQSVYPDWDNPRTSNFVVGRYDTIIDAGNVSPTVSIAASATATVAQQAVVVRATASDDAGVAAVTFSLDGTVVATDRIAPYETLVTMPDGAAAHTISAVATDYAGNSSAPASVTINTLADQTAPVLSLTSPIAGETLPAQSVHLTASASDNFSVARVEFFVNGGLVTADSAEPYEAEYAVPAGMTSINVTARAYDVAGNMTESEIRTVNVAVPQLLGVFDIGANDGAGVDVNGNTVYLAAGAAGLQIVDITNPAAPQLLGAKVSAGYLAKRVRVLGKHAFVGYDAAPGSGNNTIVSMIDVSNPVSPNIVATVNAGYAAPSRTRLYVTFGTVMPVYDFSTGALVSQGSLSFGSNGFALPAPIGDFLAVRNGDFYSGSIAVSVFDMRVIPRYSWTSVETSPKGTQILDIRSKDNYIGAALANGLLVTDYGDRMTWSTTIPGPNLTAVDLHDHYLAAASGNTPASALLYDVTNRRSPQSRGTISFAPYTSAKGIVMTPSLLLATVTDTNGAAHLLITSYRTFTDTAGRAPSVSLSTAVTSIKWTRLLPLEATASDDVGVKAVVFRVNGQDVFTDTVAPYAFNYTVPSNSGNLTIEAKAIDYAGTSTTSAPVVVSTTP